MAIKKSYLTGLGVRDSNADKYLSDLNQLMQEYQIDTELRIAHFLAQVLHESAHMKTVQENLRYMNVVNYIYGVLTDANNDTGYIV